LARYLVIRLSAIGDVAMLIQLLYSVARANEQHDFVLLTQPFITELLLDPPDNVEAMAIDIRNEEHSLLGLARYARRLRLEHFDAVLDLHDVLRTKLLRGYLRLFGIPTKHLAKPRKERRRLVRNRPGKDLTPLPPMWQLYRKVFLEAGLSVPEIIPPIDIHPSLQESFERLHPELLQGRGSKVRLGIAPFASTRAKTYSPPKMKEAVRQLAEDGRFEILLFGGRGREAETLREWAKELPHTHSVAGTLDFSEELILMATLDVVVSMDSANMHLASLVGVRVLSVWCCTHPAAGFLGIGQSWEDCLQPEGLDRRPCSIFGDNKHCHSGDFLCSEAMPPEMIVRPLLELADRQALQS